jgi:hypothetical protein
MSLSMQMGRHRLHGPPPAPEGPRSRCGSQVICAPHRLGLPFGASTEGGLHG